MSVNLSTEDNGALLAVYLRGPEDETWQSGRVELERRGFRLSHADQAMDRLVRKLAGRRKDASRAARRFTRLPVPFLAPDQQN